MELIVPSVFVLTAALALRRRCGVYGALCRGAEEGVRVVFRMFSSMTVLFAVVKMFSSCGAEASLIRLLSPLLDAVGLPPETAAIIIVRPFSGSAALAAGTDLIRQFGADSEVGRTAAVMLGSTETTFYVTGLYLSASKAAPPRYVVPCAVVGDIVGFLMAGLSVKLFF